MADVVVIAAHPHLERSRVNRALLNTARTLDAARVEVRDLYALYPDYWIDVAAEQAALAAARLVVWQHPIHWYSMPSLMKLWIDEVLAIALESMPKPLSDEDFRAGSVGTGADLEQDEKNRINTH